MIKIKSHSMWLHLFIIHFPLSDPDGDEVMKQGYSMLNNSVNLWLT